MSLSLEETFLNDHPLTQRWLDDIIRVLMGSFQGTAHVTDIARALYGEREIATMSETVTRRINDFCSDAADFNKPKDRDLFQRVRPATYRLRTYPNRPDTLELIHISFEDMTLEGMWKLFANKAASQNQTRWTALPNRQKLTVFAREMADSNKWWRKEYERRKAAFSGPTS